MSCLRGRARRRSGGGGWSCGTVLRSCQARGPAIEGSGQAGGVRVVGVGLDIWPWCFRPQAQGLHSASGARALGVSGGGVRKTRPGVLS